MKKRRKVTKKNPLGTFLGPQTTTILMVGGVAVVAYLLWKKYKQTQGYNPSSTAMPQGLRNPATGGTSIFPFPNVGVAAQFAQDRSNQAKLAQSIWGGQMVPESPRPAVVPAGGNSGVSYQQGPTAMAGMDGLACPPGDDGSGNDAMYG